ncbi:MAG: hypothetical protein ACOYKJ_06640 [Candidatus Howiella sp.]|jgi:hypothetical protein
MAEENKSAFFTYKDYPLVRCGDTIYYGNMSDKYVILIKVLSKKTVGDLEIADKVSIQLLLTDESVRPKDRIVKKSEKEGLYNAMDVGAVWLKRALAG